MMKKCWTLSGLQQQSCNFQEVPRVSRKDSSWIQKAKQYELQGMPLIVQDWHTHPGWCAEFNADWLVSNDGDGVLSTRNVLDYRDTDMTLADFIGNSRMVTTYATKDPPLYAKDVNCPQAWREWLFSGVLPEGILPGVSEDLLGHLPMSERVETIMCYYGIGGTFTPCHKNLCGSTGHNLMCHTENGSSFWFMTSSDAAPQAAAYFQEELGKELDWENHTMTLDELGNAPFPVYVAEQTLGDLFIIPPRSCHQVVNQGGLTMKLSWSRMTAKGLTTALLYELPIYRRVCRPEIYCTKSVLHHSLRYYTKKLAKNPSRLEARGMLKEAAELDALVSLFDGVLREEYGEPTGDACDEAAMWDISGRNAKSQRQRRPLSPSLRPREINSKDESSTLACDFCGADIFQSYFKCDQCRIPPGTGMQHQGHHALVMICANCYVEGRSCRCTNMVPAQRCKTQDLLDDRNLAAGVLQQCGLGKDSRVAVLTQEDLKDGDDVCVFQAACALHARRAKHLSKLDKIEYCCFDTQSPHRVRYLSTIYCTGCQVSWCLTHLLESGVHAAEAFLALHKDLGKVEGKADYSQWHQIHTKAKQRFDSIKPALTSVEKTGTFASGVAKLDARLVLAAQRFRNCRAVNSTFTIPGFYDHDVSNNESGDVTALGDDFGETTSQDSLRTVRRSQMPVSAAMHVRPPGPQAQGYTKALSARAGDPISDVSFTSDQHSVQASGAETRPDTPVDMSTTSPAERLRAAERPYVLVPLRPKSIKRKRVPLDTSKLPSKRTREEVVRPQGKSPDPDFVDDGYEGALVDVMQAAYHQPQREEPPRRRRAIQRVESPISEHDDPMPRGRRDKPPVSRPRPSQTDVRPHRKMVASSSKVTISNPQQPEYYPEPSVVGSWQPRTSGTIELAAQSSDADTTNKRALFRAPRGKPPGRPAAGVDVPPGTSNARWPKPADVRPHREMVASSSKVTISNPQQPEYPEPSVVGSWQPRTSGAIELAAQSSDADATNKRALIRAPRGKPPGRPAAGVDVLPAMRPLTTTPREPNQICNHDADAVLDLQRQLEQSETRRLEAEAEKGLVEDRIAVSERDLAAGVRGLVNRLENLEQELLEAKNALWVKGQQFEELSKRYEDQKNQLHDYQRGLLFLSDELARDANSRVALQYHSATPQDLQPQLNDAGELQPQRQVPGQLGIGIPMPGPSAAPFMIAPPPHQTPFGRNDTWTGGPLTDPSLMPMNGGQGPSFPNSWRGNSHRQYPSQSRGRTRPGRGGYPHNPSPNRPHTQSLYGAPDDVTGEWSRDEASRRRSWAPNSDRPRGQPVSSQRLRLEERLQPADGPRDRPTTPPPVPSNSLQRSSESPRREPSTSPSRTPSRSVCDQSRESSPVGDRDSPCRPQMYDLELSMSEDDGYWEDKYVMGETDDGENIVPVL